MKKYMEAKVAHGMEKEQMGERFTLIDAAKYPEKPSSPNVPAILLIGLILGAGAGAGTAAFQEHSDQTVRSVEQLAGLAGFPVLASISEITIPADNAARKRKAMIIVVSTVAGIIAALLIFHFFIMDLDIFWAKAMRRMGI